MRNYFKKFGKISKPYQLCWVKKENIYANVIIAEEAKEETSAHEN